MSKKEFYNFFVDQLQDIYSAEVQLVDALAKMEQAANLPKLKKAFHNHLEETKNQVIRLDKIYEILGEHYNEEQCEAMKGLLEEAEESMQRYPHSPLGDAALIASAQRVEHYEIAVYGCLRTFAKQLDYNDIAKLLQESLNEEGNADKTLTSIAEGNIFVSGANVKAMKS